jgi:hypothetical protein
MRHAGTARESAIDPERARLRFFVMLAFAFRAVNSAGSGDK